MEESFSVDNSAARNSWTADDSRGIACPGIVLSLANSAKTGEGRGNDLSAVKGEERICLVCSCASA